MNSVRCEISMSLDGYVTAMHPRPEEPMGDGGQVLHEWAFGDDDAGRDVHAESQDTVGASIAGRRTYDLSIPWWGADGPGFQARTPTIIVSPANRRTCPTRRVHVRRHPGSSPRHRQSRRGDPDVDVFSAGIGGQLLRAGLVDEVRIHLVPVLLGAGTRLLDDTGGQIGLVPTSVVRESKATHLRYRCSSPRSGLDRRPTAPGQAPGRSVPKLHRLPSGSRAL